NWAERGLMALGEGHQVLHDLWISCSHVALLGDVLLDVEQQSWAKVQFPAALAHGFEFFLAIVDAAGAVAVIEEQRLASGGALEKPRPDVLAVIDPIAWHLRTGEFGEGREQVHGGGERRSHGPGCHPAGPSRDARNAHAAFPRRPLAVAERTGRACGGRAVVA